MGETFQQTDAMHTKRQENYSDGTLNDKCNFTHKMFHFFQLSHTGHTQLHNPTTAHLPCSECQQIVQLHVEWWYQQQQQYNRQQQQRQKHLLAFSLLTAAVSLRRATNESTKFLVAMTQRHSDTHLGHLTTAAALLAPKHSTVFFSVGPSSPRSVRERYTNSLVCLGAS